MTEPSDETLDEERIISGYVAYFEPLRPPDELIGEAGGFIEKAAAAETRLAESLQRSGLERLVDAFLVDRRGHAECFSAAHLLGRGSSGALGVRSRSTPKGRSGFFDAAS
jgi:hypothetical protein